MVLKGIYLLSANFWYIYIQAIMMHVSAYSRIHHIVHIHIYSLYYILSPYHHLCHRFITFVDYFIKGMIRFWWVCVLERGRRVRGACAGNCWCEPSRYLLQLLLLVLIIIMYTVFVHLSMHIPQRRARLVVHHNYIVCRLSQANFNGARWASFPHP